jgi:hypothetical protein
MYQFLDSPTVRKEKRLIWAATRSVEIVKDGMPIISHQFEGKQYNHGQWNVGKMVGYTSKEVGVSGMPIRFNCPAEVTLIALAN